MNKSPLFRYIYMFTLLKSQGDMFLFDLRPKFPQFHQLRRLG